MPIILGNTTISGLAVGGLPAGSVTETNLANASVTRDKVAAGQVLQVIETRDATRGAVQNNDTQRLGTTITPTYANSRILVMANWASAHDNGNGWWTLTRGSGYSPIGYERKHGVADAVPDADTYRFTTYQPTSAQTSQEYETESYMLQYIDTPNTTSATTYYVYYRHRPEDGYRNGGTTYFNRGRLDSSTSYAVSSMILMEIKV